MSATPGDPTTPDRAGDLPTDPEAGRRAHYGQFYGLHEVPDGPVGMVHGNCQAESLRVLLSAADAGGRTWVRVPPVHELTPEDLEHLDRLLARTTTVVAQPVKDDYRGLPTGTRQVIARATAGAQRVVVPIVRYRGLHPQQRLVRGPGIEDPPLVPYHHTGAIARAAGLPDPTPGPAVVRAIAEESLAEQRRRQGASGAVPVDDLVRAAGARATNTINHPGNPVLLGLAQRVADQLGTTGEVTDPGRELLRSVYAPVTAATLEALGLDGEPRDHWLVEGEAMSDEEVVSTQAAWLRRNPRVLAFALQKVRDDLVATGAVGALRGAPSDAVSPPPAGPVHLVVGPARHGVVVHGERLARAGGEEVLRVEDGEVTAGPTPGDLAGREVVVQFTDRAFGSPPEAAAEAFERWVGRAASVQVVLHDVPQPSDGAGQARRTAAYERVVRAADRVVVSSEHERGLLEQATGLHAHRITVVPLPVEREKTDGAAAPAESTVLADLPSGPWVATLGFAYPGKGLEEVVDATAAVAADPNLPPEARPAGVLNLGGAAPGHEDLLEQLAERAAARGTRFVATGWLSQEELDTACRHVEVPVAYHRHVSASGSVNSWLAAGRRPLVVRSDYATEQHDRMPGSMVLVDHSDDLAGLAGALRAALEAPATTHQDDAVELWPSWEQAAAMLRAAR
ncbi:WcbI family polysaccharide biosynthesis putative acetyltransferase [Kytococcus sedentarius]|uniref:WcbI family polysaccharide biosynthesis putative acetyltransferase n=1 Tax=Kytococcus sedentarius TaxID=1276 RepID=UPI0035BC8014